MNGEKKEILWSQFGAAIDAVKRAIDHCPDELWAKDLGNWQFWVVVHHTSFWLDYYLSGAPKDFKPPEPFGLEEMDPAGRIPERTYTKEELLLYLEHGRQKAHNIIMNLTDEQASKRGKFTRVEMTFEELLLYTMRHVQHHAAQLNLVLRRETGTGPRWVIRAEDR